MKQCRYLESFNVIDSLCSTATVASLPPNVIHIRAPLRASKQPSPQFWTTALSNPNFLPNLEDIRISLEIDTWPPEWNETVAQAFVNVCVGREKPVRVNKSDVGVFNWVAEDVSSDNDGVGYDAVTVMADREVMEDFKKRTKTAAMRNGWRFGASSALWWKLAGPGT